MTVQTRDLAMVALGSDGQLPELEDGVHLRWQMDLILGFPPFGFDIFRRPYQAPTLTPIAAQARADGVISLGQTCRAVRLKLRWPGGSASVDGRFAGQAMTSTSVAGSIGTELVVELAADAIDEVATVPGVFVLQAHAARVNQDALQGWGAPLNGANRIGLPITDSLYPIRHGHAPDDWAEVSDRLSRQVISGGAISLPAGLANRFGGSQFQSLQGVLRQVCANGPTQFPSFATGSGSPHMDVDAAALLCLLASDADFARILGLLRVDRSAVQGTRYDYKVIGYWSPGATTSQVACTGTIDNPPGTTVVPGVTLPLLPVGDTPRIRHGLIHNGETKLDPSSDGRDLSHVVLTSIPPNLVVDISSPWGHGRGIDLIGLAEVPLRLVFERETISVVIHTTTTAAPIHVTASNVEGKKLEVGVKFEIIDGGYTAIHITGTGIVTVEVGGGPTTLFGVCTIVQTVIGDTREWICYDVKRAPPVALDAPSGLAVSAVPKIDSDDSPLLNPASIRGQHGMAAALSWSLPTSIASLSKSPIAYHVYRKDFGDGLTAPAITPDPLLIGFHRLTEDSSGNSIIPIPVKPARNSMARTPPVGWPNVPVHYVDATATERWHAYAIRGVDLFGRMSAPTMVLAELKDQLPPPPPSGTRTQFVDGLLGPGDSDFRPELQATIPAGAESVLLVDWEWLPSQYRMAPDVTEFRIYWHPSRLNALTGNITAVVDRTDTSDVTVVLDSASLPNKMTDGWLRVGPDYFHVIGSTTGATPVVTVKNLRITRAASGSPMPPGLGRCSISVGGGDGVGLAPDANFKDFRSPVQWNTRLLTVPMVPPVIGQITNVAAYGVSGIVPINGWYDHHDGTSSVALGIRLTDGDGALRGGVLLIGGVQFPILGNSDGPNVRIVVQNTGAGIPPAAPNPLPSGQFSITTIGIREVATDIASSILTTGVSSLTLAGGTLVTPNGEYRVASVYINGSTGNLAFGVYTDSGQPVSGSCVWFPGYRLAIVPVPSLSVGSNASASGAVGISCSDGRAYVADTRGDTARLGNEGAVCAPMIVTRQRHAPVPAPSAPGGALPTGQLHLYASKPDYFGHSMYTLSWTASSGTAYVIYRALDDALFLRDREQRRKLTGYYAGRRPFDDDAGFNSWFATYSAGVPGLTFANLTAAESSLTPEQNAAVVAALEQWAARFYPTLDDVALRSLADRIGNETVFIRLNVEPILTSSFEDTLDGRAPSRFLYRVRAIDIAGNQSDLSPSSLPVYVPTVLAPARPTLLEAAGGDGVIKLRWIENKEADLDGYFLYRSESADDADDLRTMALHQRVAKSPTSPLRTGEVAPTTMQDATGTVIPGRLELSDGSSLVRLPAKKNFYYRLVGVNSAGVSSPPSAVIVGQCYQLPPGPTTLAQPIWDGNHTTVAVTWSATDSNLECQVERRILGRQMWKVVSGWLARGVYSYQDTDVDGTLRYEYRIRVRDVYGQTNSSFQIQATQ